MSGPSDAMLEEVAPALLLMAELLANPKPVSAELVRMWALVLQEAGVRPEEVEGGVCRVLQAERFFPTPADFLRVVRPPENREAVEELAWQRVLGAVQRLGAWASLCAADLSGDGAALWAVERLGWTRLCQELEEGNRSIWRAEFLRVYRVARELGEVQSYLPGAAEQQNGLTGVALSPAGVGRPDWEEKALGAGG